MMTGWFLVLLASSYGRAYEKIPMQSLEACMTAKNLVLDNQIADKAICVPTGEK